MTDPVQHQLQAFNRRDLDAFMEAYTADVRIEDGKGGKILSGTEEMRAFYGALFSNSPNLHCDVVNRISVGNWVIDEEKGHGVHAEGFPEEVHLSVAYEVSDGKIRFVRMFL